MGGSCRPGHGSVLCLQYAGKTFRSNFSSSCIEQRANQITNHVAQKAVAGELKDKEFPRLLMNSRLINSPYRASTVTVILVS